MYLWYTYIYIWMYHLPWARNIWTSWYSWIPYWNILRPYASIAIFSPSQPSKTTWYLDYASAAHDSWDAQLMSKRLKSRDAKRLHLFVSTVHDNFKKIGSVMFNMSMTWFIYNFKKDQLWNNKFRWLLAEFLGPQKGISKLLLVPWPRISQLLCFWCLMPNQSGDFCINIRCWFTESLTSNTYIKPA